MKLGWADRATGGKNQDGSRVGVATVAALVWPFPVWVCRMRREPVAAWGVRRGGDVSFFFTVSVSPLFSFLFFSFVFGFLFFFFTFFFFRLTCADMLLTGLAGWDGGLVILIRGPKSFFLFFWEKIYLLNLFFFGPRVPDPLRPSPESVPE